MRKYAISKYAALYETERMWRWIYVETLKRHRKVQKSEYFDEVYNKNQNTTEEKFKPESLCFLCEYANGNYKNEEDYCTRCPFYFNWGIERSGRYSRVQHCYNLGGIYNKWCYYGVASIPFDYVEEIAECAKMIADLVKEELEKIKVGE